MPPPGVSPLARLYGVDRVLEPQGRLPYEAIRLDPSGPVRDHEVELAVDSLHLDSASWTQIKDQCEGSADQMQFRIMDIVRKAGKLHNPVTGSGGMLVGTVTAKGAQRDDLELGDRVFSLTSMTCTPLEIEEILALDPASPQVRVRARAFLPGIAAYARVPENLEPEVALGVADICGAPAWAAELAKPGMKVAVVGGGGKAGLMACAAAVEQVGGSGQVLALCWPPPTADLAASAATVVERVDCTDALLVLECVRRHFGAGMADLVIVCVNVRGCEASSILAAADDGEVVFFSMATSFPAVALIAESLARTCRLTVGNGFLPGHAEYAFGLASRMPQLHSALSGRRVASENA